MLRSQGGFNETMHHLLSGRPLNGWTLRKIMEAHATYADATAAIAVAPYASPEYAAQPDRHPPSQPR